jgi:hypothetical protein
MTQQSNPEASVYIPIPAEMPRRRPKTLTKIGSRVPVGE